MKKTIFFLIFITIIFTCINSNSNFKNGLDEYYFVIAIGLDRSNSGKLLFSIQISSSKSNSKDESSQSSSSKVFTAEGNTIEECISSLNNYLNKQIDLSHCSAIIFSEELSSYGINNFINSLTNEYKLKNNTKIIISSEKAIDILNNVTNSGEVFSARLYDYLTTTKEYTGYTIKSNLIDFGKSINNRFHDSVAIYCLVNLENKTIETDGIAIFKNDKYIGKTSKNDSISHLLLTNNLNNCEITLPNPFIIKDFIDLKLTLKKKTSYKISLINNTPYITIDIYPECNIINSGSAYNYSENENIDILKNSCDNYLSKNIKDYLYLVNQDYKTDILNLTSYFNSNYLTLNEADKYNFKNNLSKSIFHVNVHTFINSSSIYSKNL